MTSHTFAKLFADNYADIWNLDIIKQGKVGIKNTISM
jgi:hypothetical protein